MRILVLSQLSGSPGTEVFLEIARGAGHEAVLCNPLALRHVAGRPIELPLATPDCVFTRMGSATPEGGFDVLRSLELRGLACVNRPTPLRTGRDKTRTFIELAAAELPLPYTILSAGRASAADLAAELGPPPWVLKQAIGSKGQEVSRVDSEADLAAALASAPPHSRVQLQRFVHEAAGRDLRVLVVAGRAECAVERRAAPGEWRSNLHQGGSVARAELEPRAVEVAEACARALDLDVCGVDLLRGADGPLVAEVNGSPGLFGLRRAHGDGPVHAILELLERRARDSAARASS